MYNVANSIMYRCLFKVSFYFRGSVDEINVLLTLFLQTEVSIPSALNAGAKGSGPTCHMAMPQCCYLAKGAKRPSHTTNTIKFDRIPFDP